MKLGGLFFREGIRDLFIWVFKEYKRGALLKMGIIGTSGKDITFLNCYKFNIVVIILYCSNTIFHSISDVWLYYANCKLCVFSDEQILVQIIYCDL